MLPGPVIAIVGTTATGKTPLGVSLAQGLQAQYGVSAAVISADSQLVYQGLDIGTAKPTVAEQQGVVHYGMDWVAPNEPFSVAQYQALATPVLDTLLAEGKIPIVVGGTGFYIKALLESQFIPAVPPDPAFRAQIAELAQREGRPAVYARLQALDPARAAALYPNDLVRVTRALEIIHHTGQPVSNQVQPRPYQVLWIGLHHADRTLLDAKILARITAMLDAGWLDEVQQLMARFGPQAPALQVAHGYPELVQVCQGQITLDQAVAQININVRQYARRQLTWFKRNPHIHWFNVDSTPAVDYTQQVLGIVHG
jgi:tRNA dimethylallyltransferase